MQVKFFLYNPQKGGGRGKSEKKFLLKTGMHHPTDILVTQKWKILEGEERKLENIKDLFISSNLKNKTNG